MNQLGYIWAKTSDTDMEKYHPLLLHLLDVAACTDAILDREPESTRLRMAEIFGIEWKEARPCLLLLIASHDLGKASPGFQLKWDGARDLLEKAGLHIPKLPDTNVNHAFISQFALAKLLIDLQWPEDLAEYCADAIGCHHGTRATPVKLDKISGDRNGVDGQNWEQVWKDLFESLCCVFQTGKPPLKDRLSGPDFMLLSGLTSFADWIGSNEEWFPFGTLEDCNDLTAWFNIRRQNAEKALSAIGWNKRMPLIATHNSFSEAFPKCSPPRPLQDVVAKTVGETQTPCVLLIEAPMGEGKTEAAFYAHLELHRRFGHRGLYIAMPTKATGNAMFSRTLEFLKSFSGDRTLDFQLLHGATHLNDLFQKVRLGEIHTDEENGTIQASVWFTHKKRALLSEYGVGTIDQALLTILPVRHYFVRLWGLANRVVIFDEIHAYDAYTGTLLFHLIKWLRALGSSVVLLSATLPPEFRRRLADAMGKKLPEKEEIYPRMTVFKDDTSTPEQIHFDADPNRLRELEIVPLDTTLTTICTCLHEKLPNRGYAGVIVNTVQRAQYLYMLFGNGEEIYEESVVIGKRLPDGTRIYLFHARYPANERQKREDTVLALFGKNEDEAGNLKMRNGRHILIATQVVEQSLDLDFDLLITDLAPIDLLLQRAGRLWRHTRNDRQVPIPLLCVAGLAEDSPGSFGEPLWWNAVYHEDILLRTREILKSPEHHKKITIPNEIELLVNDVYNGLTIPTDEEVLRRLDKAEIENEGLMCAQRTMAHQAIIGLPNDSSWKDTSQFYLYDDDEPGVHPTLKAQTRLSEDSVVAVPLIPADLFCKDKLPEFATAKEWALRAVSLSRKSVVKQLRKIGMPDGWKKSPLLRNYYPLIFDKELNWIEDRNVHLHKELGIVYISKEVK